MNETNLVCFVNMMVVFILVHTGNMNLIEWRNASWDIRNNDVDVK